MKKIMPLFLIIIMFSCKNLDNSLPLKNKIFYLLHKDGLEHHLLCKTYFQGDMQSYTFTDSSLIDKTRSAIMEPQEYIYEKYVTKDSLISLSLKYYWNKEIKKEIKFVYNVDKGILTSKEFDTTLYFIESTKLDQVKTVYLNPCINHMDTWNIEDFEIRHCLDEFVLDEEKRRIRNNDFNWYPKLDCNLYFKKELCDEIELELEYIQQWQGSYSFGYGFRGSDDNYEMAFKIDSTSATIFNKKNNQETQRQASIVRATNDSLELRDKNNAQYILYKQNGGPRYAITGEATYLLNPPNDHYPVTKDQ